MVKIASFCCMDSVPMISQSLVYIYFEKRVSLWGWPSYNMVTIFVREITVVKLPRRRKILPSDTLEKTW